MNRHDVYLGLGSNVGERERFLARSVDALRKIPESKVVWVSHVYETEPYGKKDQPAFLNAALHMETPLAPDVLFTSVKAIETDLGREDGVHWGPREIDIDILIYDGLVFDKNGLKVPHPDMQNRNFVLLPLMDIAPDLVHPVTGLTISEMVLDCRTGGRVVRSIHTIKY